MGREMPAALSIQILLFNESRSLERENNIVNFNNKIFLVSRNRKNNKKDVWRLLSISLTMAAESFHDVFLNRGSR